MIAPAALRDRCETLLSRWVFATLDAAATAGVAIDSTAAEEATFARRSRYDRLRGSVARLSRWVPGGLPAVQRLLVVRSRLPFRASDIRVIGCGTAVTVFLLTGAEAEAPVVLKVCRETLGRQRAALLADARRRRATYQRVAGWYGDRSPLLPTSFLVGRSPLLSLPAVACVQPYAGRGRGIFGDLTEGELLALARSAPALRLQIVSFAAGTARSIAREGACVDLLGRDNLILIGVPPDVRLVLLDHGVQDLRKARATVVAETHRRVAYLQRVADQLELPT